MAWSAIGSAHYKGRRDDVYLSTSARWSLDEFIEYFLKRHDKPLSDENRMNVAAILEKYPISAPWRAQMLTHFVEQFFR